MGSTSTLEVTSRSRVAVTSRISLCLMMTYPPLAQLRAWLVSLCFPQMQILGIPCGLHPYLRARASRNAPLCNTTPCSSIGITVSHADAPFSCTSSTAFFMVEGSWSPISAAILFFWFLFFSVMSLLALSCFASIRSSFPPPFLIASFRGWLMAVDVAYGWSAISVGMSKPSPPSRAGKAKSFLSMSLMLLLPVIPGMTLCLRVSSIGCNSSLMFHYRWLCQGISDLTMLFLCWWHRRPA